MALVVLAALGAVGTPARADKPENPFAGSWSGTWSHLEDEDVGTFDWTISDAGRITGTAYSITTGFGGAVVGHVGADGNLVLIGAVPNDVHAGGSGYPHHGTAEINDDDKLVVSATGTGAWAISFDAILESNN